MSEQKLQKLGHQRACAPHKLEPYPAQMVCLGYHGDGGHDESRSWWWAEIGDAYVRCQDAARADIGWFRPRLRLV